VSKPEPKPFEAWRCPYCGGVHIIRHGFRVTRRGRRQLLKCQGCGHVFAKAEA
jgi:uncharacterized Zn finger protein